MGKITIMRDFINLRDFDPARLQAILTTAQDMKLAVMRKTLQAKLSG